MTKWGTECLFQRLAAPTSCGRRATEDGGPYKKGVGGELPPIGGKIRRRFYAE